MVSFWIPFIIEKRICIEKCEFDADYKYDYRNRCFRKCPDGTHISYEDEFICEDEIKCPEFNINNTKCDEDAKFGYYMDKNEDIVATTNSYGIATFANIPAGTYYLYEVTQFEYYSGIGNVNVVDLQPSETTEIEVENKLKRGNN